MFLIDTDQAVAEMPAPAGLGALSGWFTDDAPGSSDGTVCSADWLNMLQAELLAILAAAGIAPSKAVTNQVLTAIRALIATSIPTDFNSIGYFELPNGLIVQWGTAQTASNGMVTVTFPLTFPNHALFGMCGNGASAGALAGYFTGNDTPTLTQMVLAANVATAGVGINWLAIGD